MLDLNSFYRSLIVSEKSKSVVLLGYMKSMNLLCSVVPVFLIVDVPFFFFFFYLAIIHSLS